MSGDAANRPPRRAPTPLWTEQAALGEIDNEQANALGVRPVEVERLRASNREILALWPPQRMAAAILRRARSRRRGCRGLAWGLAVPLAAPALILLWAGQDPEPAAGPKQDLSVQSGSADTSSPFARGPERPDELRSKGSGPRLEIYRRTRGKAERLDSGASAAAGDVIQIGYVAAGPSRGVVVSLDGRGVVTLHYPERPDRSPTLQRRGRVALEHAYELDDAPRFERFIFVTDETEALTVDEVLQAAQQVARGDQASELPLPLDSNYRQSSLLLRKTP